MEFKQVSNAEIERNSAVILKSYVEIAKKFKSPEKRLKWYDAIIDYLFCLQEPNFGGDIELEIGWLGISHHLKKSISIYKNGAAAQSNKQKRDETETRPKQERSETETRPKQERSETETRPKQERNGSETKFASHNKKELELDYLVNNIINIKNKRPIGENTLATNVFSSYERTAKTERVRARSMSEREPFVQIFKSAFEYGLTKEKTELAYEIIDTIIEATEQATTTDGLKFNKKTYLGNSFAKLILNFDATAFISVMNTLFANDTIKNRPSYILQCIINQAEEKLRVKEKDHEDFLKLTTKAATN